MASEVKDKIISFVVFSICVFFIGIIGYIFIINILNFVIDKNEAVDEVETVSEVESNIENNNNNSTISNNANSSVIEGLDNSTSSNSSSQTTNVDKYFYNQLDDYAKIVYKALYTNKENIKSGTYVITFNDEFTDLLNQDNGSNKLQEYYQDAVDAFFFDNPDVFWMEVNKLYINIDTETKFMKKSHKVYLDYGKNSNYLSEGFNSKSDVDKAISKVEEAKNNLKSTLVGTDYEKALKIHDYLVESITYKDTNDNIHNIYGALVTKECVCEGYAKAFKYLADEAGVNNVLIKGTGTNSSGESEKHAWNVIKLSNQWYALDSTWDDPVVIGGGTASSMSKYKYFLKGSSTMNKDHTQSGFIIDGGKEFTYPTISVTDYQ